jgi:hypothetical protein
VPPPTYHRFCNYLNPKSKYQSQVPSPNPARSQQPAGPSSFTHHHGITLVWPIQHPIDLFYLPPYLCLLCRITRSCIRLQLSSFSSLLPAFALPPSLRLIIPCNCSSATETSYCRHIRLPLLIQSPSSGHSPLILHTSTLINPPSNAVLTVEFPAGIASLRHLVLGLILLLARANA